MGQPSGKLSADLPMFTDRIKIRSKNCLLEEILITVQLLKPQKLNEYVPEDHFPSKESRPR